MIFFSCQIDWCYKLLTVIWQNFFCSNDFSNVKCKISNLKIKIADKRDNWPWFHNANLILVTSSTWINCSFSRPSKVRMSFYQIAAKFFFFKFKICQTVARHKYDQSISQKIFRCLSLTNYLISKLRLPYIRVISAIVDCLSTVFP